VQEFRRFPAAVELKLSSTALPGTRTLHGMRRVALGLALLPFLLTACSGDDDDTSKPTATSPPSPAPSASPSPTPRVGTVVPSVGPFVTPTSGNIYGELPEAERSVLRDLEGRVFPAHTVNGLPARGHDRTVDPSERIVGGAPC
jgi:hypothetical protein